MKKSLKLVKMQTSASNIVRVVFVVLSSWFIGIGSSYAQTGFGMGNTLKPVGASEFPIILANQAKGGHHQVATIAERDAIFDLRREVGMLCTVLDAGSGSAKTYQLIGGIANSNWVEFASGSGGSAESFTGDLAGDVTGTQGATVVGKINGTSLAGLATGILKNTTTTGIPTIAVAGTDYLTPTGSAALLTNFPTLNQNTTGNAATVTTNANLTGEVTSLGNAATVDNAAVIGKVLTGFTSGAGTIDATDNILQAIQKLDGNSVAGANATHTGEVTGSGALTIANDAVTTAKILNSNVSYAKIQNVSATDKVLGRITAGSGVVEEISTTGSGNVVRATSPTLVTPALGTPSALVGTNITGTASGLTAGNVTTNANLTGEVTSLGNAATVDNAAVIGKVLTGFTSGAGPIAATDNILQAIQKLDGNSVAGANATHTGEVTGSGALTIANDAVTTAKILDANVTDAKIAAVSGSKVSGNISGNAANVTGIVAVANGGTGQSTALVPGGVLYGETATTAAVTPVGTAGQVLTSNAAGTPTWSSGIALTGDVLVNSSGVSAIQPAKVTLGMMKAMTTNSLLGSGSGTAVSEISLGSGLSFTGTTLNATGSGGTVTSVAALTLGTTGTDVSSSVASGTSTPVITLNIPTASASNRGALSTTDWSNFNKYNQWDGGSTGLTAATGRTSLGATTIGSNLFTLTNPGAITFPQFNANNTVTALDAASFRAAIGAGTGGGDMTLAGVQTVIGAKTFGGPGAVGKLIIAGTTSGTTILDATAAAGSGTVTLPISGTLTTLDGSEILTNKTIAAGSNTISGLTNTQLSGSAGITNANLATMPTMTIKGNNTGGSAVPGDLTKAQMLTLLNVADGATNYSHPANHPPSIITQDASNRFVTDAEKTAWNAKGTGTVTSVGGTGTVSGLSLSGSVTTSGNLTLGGTLSLTSGNVTTALGFTPIPLSGLSSTATGLTYTNTTGVFSLTSGYYIPTTTDQTAWNAKGTGTVTSVGTGTGLTGGSITGSGIISLANMAAYSIKGNATNASAAPSDIAAVTDGHVLRLSGTTLGFGTVGTNGLTDNAVTLAKMQQISTSTLLGRSTALTGNVESIAIGSGLALSGGTLTATGSGGTVTSVGGTGTISGLSLSGTVTTTGNLTLGGTLAVLPSNFASQTTKTFLAAPNAADGVPTFRTLVASDIPMLNQNTTGTAANVTGVVAIANGGTGSATQNFVDLTTAQTIAGAKTFSSAIAAPTATNTINGLVVNAGALSGVTGYAQTSGNFAHSGTGTFGTGTGAVSLNGDATMAATKTLYLAGSSGTIGLKGNGAVTSYTLTLPAAVGGSSGLVLTTTDASGTLGWTAAGTTSPITIVNSSNLFSTGLTGSGSGVSGTSNSIFFGEYAGSTATSASNSNFLGYGAGSAASSATNSNFFGSNAGNGATSATSSNFFGPGAGTSATGANSSNFFGSQAGNGATNASNSNFLGYQAGNGAINALNSVFIGQEAGKSDNVNNTSNSMSSILIGSFTKTGGFSNSILLGSGLSGTPISNTKANQFMLAPTVTEMRLRGVDYTLPSAQASVAGQVLTNDAAGVLSWATPSVAPDATTGAKGIVKLAGDLAGTAALPTVKGINGVALSGLTTGILKNTTTTGVPSIAVAGDFPLLNQNTTGTSANVTGIVAIANGGTGSSTQNFVDLTTTQTIGGAKTFSVNVTAPNFTLSSDRRLKTNIRPINVSLLGKINYVQYTLKADSTNRLRYGVIAQDVEKVAPELVYTDDKGVKSVAYTDLLIAQMAQMAELIKSLENRIKALENEK